MTIQAAVQAEPQILSLDTILDVVIKEMFSQIVNSLEQQSSKSITALAISAITKNQIELLRCFAALAIRYSDKLVPFCLQKFEQTNEKTRVASLTILKHLINSCKEQMENKQQLVVSGLRLLIADNNNKVIFFIKCFSIFMDVISHIQSDLFIMYVSFLNNVGLLILQGNI